MSLGSFRRFRFDPSLGSFRRPRLGSFHRFRGVRGVGFVSSISSRPGLGFVSSISLRPESGFVSSISPRPGLGFVSESVPKGWDAVGRVGRTAFHAGRPTGMPRRSWWAFAALRLDTTLRKPDQTLSEQTLNDLTRIPAWVRFMSFARSMFLGSFRRFRPAIATDRRVEGLRNESRRAPRKPAHFV
jgi:hypothetical protein